MRMSAPLSTCQTRTRERRARDHVFMDDEGQTVTLWRPTGPEELALVEASGWRAWPPRLPDQPIFYPVLSQDYATSIAPLLQKAQRHGVRVFALAEGVIEKVADAQTPQPVLAAVRFEDVTVKSGERSQFLKKPSVH